MFPILNPPPSPYHPSGSSKSTSPKHPVSWIEPGLVTHFIYDIIHVSMPFSPIIPPSPSPTESKRLFYTSVSLLLSRIQCYCYHFSKFHIYAYYTEWSKPERNIKAFLKQLSEVTVIDFLLKIFLPYLFLWKCFIWLFLFHSHDEKVTFELILIGNREEQERKGIQIGKEEVKLTLATAWYYTKKTVQIPSETD